MACLFSTAKDGDTPGTAQGFRDAGSARFSNASVKSPLLASLRNLTKRTSKSRQPEIAPPLTQFELLPPELILELARHLSLSSALALGYTCRSFRGTIEAKVEDLDYVVEMKSFLKDPEESEDERWVVLERLAFLCMLERDKRLSASTAVCRGCKTARNVSVFSFTALRQRPHQRLCMSCEGRLWICPHRSWDQAQLREVERLGWTMIESVAQCGCLNGEVLISSSLRSSPPTEEYLLNGYYPVLAMPQGFEFHASRIRKALIALGVNICPHLRFGDAIILDAFHPGCTRLKVPWFPERCAWCNSHGSGSVCGVEVNCESCKTRTTFYPSESNNETTTLWARVTRRITKSAGSVTDPTWIAYLYTPAQYRENGEQVQ